VLAIYGGWKLYRNAAPERLHGTVPVTDDIVAYQQKNKAEIEARRAGNRVGFGFLTIGSCLQLIGTVIAGFTSGG
jgi:hypothetical protein